MALNISRLGFGLSGIAGSGNFAYQQRLIETALDCGITHFDVAPFYGSGDAEKILGKILKNNSSNVTITTKYGLVPFAGGWAGSLLRNALRPIFRHAKSIKRISSAVINHIAQPKTTGKKSNLLESLDSSITKLKKPIDIFLLHDSDIEFAQNVETIEALEEAKKLGKVKLTGISGSAETVQRITQWNQQTYTVVQLENSLACPAPILSLYQCGTNVITYGAIQGGIKKLEVLMQSRPAFKKKLIDYIGVRLSNSGNLGQMLIEMALAENPTGSVLFSTTHVDRIKKMAASLNSSLLREDDCLKIRQLFQEASCLEEQIPHNLKKIKKLHS